MGKRLRFVTPEVVRVALSDGDWIEIKRRLTVGERRRILSRAASGGISSDGARVHVDAAEMAFARVEAWMLDWSFTGLDEKPVAYSPAALKNLDPETFTEIESAIDAHEVRVSAEGKASGAPEPPAISA
jgi:hypothetical protein